MEHEGTLEDLQTIIRGCGFNISEVKDQEHGHQLKTSEGAIVNWYTSTGTVITQRKFLSKIKNNA